MQVFEFLVESELSPYTPKLDELPQKSSYLLVFDRYCHQSRQLFLIQQRSEHFFQTTDLLLKLPEYILKILNCSLCKETHQD